jgi:hypothetical protein
MRFWLTVLRFWLTVLLVLLTVTPAAAAVTVAARAGASDSSAVTTREISLPSGSVAGSLIILGVSCRDSTGTVTLNETGWTKLFSETQSVATSRVWLEAYYKRLSGSETTLTLNTSATVMCAWATWRMTGEHASSNPESVDGSAITQNPDPPSLSPSWGNEAAVFIVLTGVPCDAATCTVSTYPTNYTTNGRQFQSGNGVEASIGASDREATTGTENPGTFALSSSQAASAATIAVRSAPAATVGRGVIGGGCCGGMID